MKLETKLGYEFRDKGMLKQALTHRSAGKHNNERLEFIGDGVLNFIIAETLYRTLPEAAEGDLSRLRARLVKGETLANVSRELDIGPHIRMGSGEMKSGGERRESILADAFEAIIGAIFLDSGFETCQQVVQRLFSDRVSTLPDASELKDPKTKLQEYLQSRQYHLPSYKLIKSEGADHNKLFTVSCVIPQLKIEIEATGRSRRKAEQSAAEQALSSILN